MLFIERVRMICILCLTAFGCTGNTLTFIVVNRRFFRKTALAAFIAALSVADCIVLCLQSLQILTKLHPTVTSYDCIIFFLIDVFRLLSVWLVCFINLERCSLVFNPCQMPRLTSRRKARTLILILIVFSLLIFSHYAKHMKIGYVKHYNQTSPVRSFCAYRPNFNRLVWEYIRSGLTYWLTIPICIVCNLIIIRCLHQASKIERKFNDQQIRLSTTTIQPGKIDLSSKQRQLTAMLLTSSICFVLTATPSTVHSIYLLIKKPTNTGYIIHICTNILLHFHHASNFLAFMCSCARFRTELMNFFRRHLRCQISTSWHQRSLPHTEHGPLNSKKQQRTPVQLLTPSRKSDRLVQSPVYPHIAIQLNGNFNYHPRTGRNHSGPNH